MNEDEDKTAYTMHEDVETNTNYLYHHFRMVLPKGSKVKRLPDHQIEIETKKLKMILSVKFETRMLAFDPLFLYFYMSNKHLLERFAYEIKIDIQVSVKWHSLLTSSGWDYYQWVDSFLSVIEDEVSEKAFMHRIHWEDALTVLLCLENTEVNVKEGQKIPPLSVEL
jgi:hypothetical protein